MQNKYFKYIFLAILMVFIIPQITLASWWNPFSWNWNIFSWFKPKQIQQSQIVVDSNKLNDFDIKNATYVLNTGANYKFINGKILINNDQFEMNIVKISKGDLNSDDKEDAAVIINISPVGDSSDNNVLAILLNSNGKPSYLTQKGLYSDTKKVNSISISSGTIIINEKPSELAKTLKYQLLNNKLELIKQPVDTKLNQNTTNNSVKKENQTTKNDLPQITGTEKTLQGIVSNITSSGKFTLTVNNVAYIVDLLPMMFPTIFDKNNNFINFSDIKNGDTVSVTGYVSGINMSALFIGDLSITTGIPGAQITEDTWHGVVSSINLSQKSFILIADEKNYIVKLHGEGSILVGPGFLEVAFSDIKNGDTVSVTGFISDNTISAVLINDPSVIKN